MIETTVMLSSKLSGLHGTLYDMMSFIDTGYRRSYEAIATGIVDANGVIIFNVPRESQYLLILRGYPKNIYHNVGSPSNWERKNQVLLPYQPTLKSIEDKDVKYENDSASIQLYWHTKEEFGAIPIKTYFSVEYRKKIDNNYTEWQEIINDLEVKTYIMKVTEKALYEFRVRGRNKYGNYGKYSNVSSYNITNIIGDNVAPDSENAHYEYYIDWRR